MNLRTLQLSDLGSGVPALTPEIGAYFTQACYVCFASNGHDPTITLQVVGSFMERFTIEWPGAIDDQMRRAWNDLDEATEQAAYAIAILLIRSLTPHTIIERSRRGSGFDYWIGDQVDDSVQPFQQKAQLEASGILQGNIANIRSRVVRKLKQIKRANNEFPSYVIVVEFSQPIAWVELQ